MNKRIETVLSNKNAKPTDYFELVNLFELSMLTLQDDKHRSMSMDINEFSAYSGEFKFSQKRSNSYFVISEEDIQSVSGKALGDKEFLINVNRADGFNIEIYIFCSDDDIKSEECKRYWEMEIERLCVYLSNEKHVPLSASVYDRFGFLVKSEKVDKLSLIEDKKSGAYRVEILNKIDTEISFWIEEDKDKIYINYGELMDTILIRPYGQPFMEIKIIVAKR